ncbi:hypothetical protein BJV82DRAFT_630250 [Fennellomyces sp. T-0311]|nr:hypothetical protein BJV82DRAFT_630250 [Fennellomyces sp. T-0311]
MIDYAKGDQAFDTPVKSTDRPSSYAYQSLPPTPSSSAQSFILTTHEQQETNEKPLRLSLPKSNYGALSLTWPQSPTTDSMMTSDHSVPSTPPHTTVGPDDDEEGLYLAWTHQLLREHGFRPQSCHGGLDADSDDDSSLSDDEDRNDTRKSWLSCFPTCFR